MFHSNFCYFVRHFQKLRCVVIVATSKSFSSFTVASVVQMTSTWRRAQKIIQFISIIAKRKRQFQSLTVIVSRLSFNWAKIPTEHMGMKNCLESKLSFGILGSIRTYCLRDINPSFQKSPPKKASFYLVDGNAIRKKCIKIKLKFLANFLSNMFC